MNTDNDITQDEDQTRGLLAAVLADLSDVVGGIDERQLHDPTPCTDYDVAQLRDHVLGWLNTFADGFADPGGQAPRASLDGYQAPADAGAEVDRGGRPHGPGAARGRGQPAAAARGQRHARRHGPGHDPLGVSDARLGPGPRHRSALVAAGRGGAGSR